MKQAFLARTAPGEVAVGDEVAAFVRSTVEDVARTIAAQGRTADSQRTDGVSASHEEEMTTALRTLSPAEVRLLSRIYLEGVPQERACGEAGISPAEFRVLKHRLRVRFDQRCNPPAAQDKRV